MRIIGLNTRTNWAIYAAFFFALQSPCTACPGTLIQSGEVGGPVTLEKAFALEQQIYRIVYSHEEILDGKWIAFWHPPFGEVPHWNLVYPKTIGAVPTTEELQIISKFYEERKVKAHVVVPAGTYEAHAVSHDEFFYLAEAPEPANLPDGLSVELTEDMDTFTQLVKAGFQMPEPIVPDFVSQMKKIKEATPSRFYIAGSKGTPYGCVSTFQSLDGYDFIMNLAVLEQHRNRGAGRALLSTLAQTGNQHIVTHTNNPIVQRMLPTLGYRSCGKVSIVEVDRLLKDG